MKEYMKIATKEDILSMTEEQSANLCKMARQQTIDVDPVTFEPFVIISSVRYNIMTLCLCSVLN